MAISWVSRIQAEAKDFLELVAVPSLAAVLPWPLCYRIFRKIATKPWLYEEACQQAFDNAQQRGWASDRDDWLLKRRLVTLIDHADFYLARTRSDRWLERHVVVRGRWPEPKKAGILASFHWGAGMWGLRSAQAAGLRPHALVAAIDGDTFKGRTVLHHYVKARTACVADALGRPTLDVSQSLRPVLKTLRSDEQVLAVLDVPSDQAISSTPIEIAGIPARVPKALLRLACDQQIPVTVYITGFDFATGQRTLKIKTITPHANFEKFVADIFRELDAVVQAEPPAWHFWGEADRFFTSHSQT